MPEVSQNLQKVLISPIRGNDDLIKEAVDDGADVIQLQIGTNDKPDFLNGKGKTIPLWNYRYGPSLGRSEMRDLVAKRYIGFDIEPEDSFVVHGISQGVDIVQRAVLNPGEAMIMADPVYHAHPNFMIFNDRNVVPVSHGSVEQGLIFPSAETIDDIVQRSRKGDSPKIKAILLVNPSNPTGYVLNENELKSVIDIAVKNDLWVIVDSAYRDLGLENKVVNPFSIKGAADVVIDMGSSSKTYGLTGARVAWIVTKHDRMKRSLANIASDYLGASIPAQMAVLEADKYFSHEIVTQTVNEFKGRRDAVCSRLDALKDLGLTYARPQGGFCVYIQVNGINAQNLIQFALSPEYLQGNKNKTVSFAPGYGFHLTNFGFNNNTGINDNGHDKLRLALVQPKELLEEAIGRLANVLEQFRHYNVPRKEVV